MIYTTVKMVREIERKLPTSITDQDIEVFIEKAEAYVSGALGGVYQLPFFPVPKLIEMVTTDLAIFYLAESLYTSNQPNLDQYYIEKFERIKQTLHEIATGDLTLTTPDGLIVKARDSGASGYATTNDQQLFTYEEPYW